MKLIEKDGLELVTFDNLTATGMVKHGFTTRHGGVSTGCYASMNMGFSRGEERAPVAENYRILARALELDETAFVATQQTHTTNILKVGAADKGSGVTKDREYKDVDGLMTDEAGINLVIFGADCVPVFLLDPEHHAIGMAHCGWKGTANGMAKKIVERMTAEYSTDPQKLVAAIGPSIGKCCFQVDDPVVNLFRRQLYFADEVIFDDPSEEGKYKIDLWETNRRLLADCGVKNIEIAGLCTMCDTERFYSHRKMGERRGVMAGVMCLCE
ncbi:peptidoglycan editing factor PgeF [Anaerotignum lactatifermentans]|uniref:Purine nucleoside phosphorylase n=1 Tax=Anaerotignum lactatifermentans TaxID=160404 RepID=A0ABS2GCI5_9FIRM|nr:peptidoglycan editing factor PgeF [Anaerotignum lactatifermentans]MBM6828620.1 peptidoglycan editing factor PgeF [Anaerotignum lactatifermentans]MBM6878508.1 peptidoglycan editing factor PgeF [Anaerotignum lactatifermentans]MBM6950202.1 peptidoglycan editing factor PgeF [Anaerotignum lactatifermentans]